MAGHDSSPVPFRMSRLVFRALFRTGDLRYLVCTGRHIGGRGDSTLWDQLPHQTGEVRSNDKRRTSAADERRGRDQ